MYKSSEVYEMNSPCNAKDELLRILGTKNDINQKVAVSKVSLHICSKYGIDSRALDIKCADITIKACTKRALEQFGEYQDPNPVVAKLHVSRSGVDLGADAIKEFLNKLDVVYDCGYGGQELFGTVWLTDGTWLTREEYDGSEGWLHHKLPEIPEDLL